MPGGEYETVAIGPRWVAGTIPEGSATTGRVPWVLRPGANPDDRCPPAGPRRPRESGGCSHTEHRCLPEETRAQQPSTYHASRLEFVWRRRTVAGVAVPGGRFEDARPFKHVPTPGESSRDPLVFRLVDGQEAFTNPMSLRTPPYTPRSGRGPAAPIPPGRALACRSRTPVSLGLGDGLGDQR